MSLYALKSKTTIKTSKQQKYFSNSNVKKTLYVKKETVKKWKFKNFN